MTIKAENIAVWLEELEKTFVDNKEYLTDLDAAIGDADHGINMARGFKEVKADLSKTESHDISSLLKMAAMNLIRKVGGASGPLYGTFFLRAASACAGKNELTPHDVAVLFEAGLKGVKERGKAELKDKTMVDALTPAVEAMNKALDKGADLKTLLEKAAEAAHEGMKDTTDLQAKKGRASYLGERSIGHIDPGAASSYLMIKTCAQVWE